MCIWITYEKCLLTSLILSGMEEKLMEYFNIKLHDILFKFLKYVIFFRDPVQWRPLVVDNLESTTKNPADLVTFTEEILNGKLHFFCSVVVSLFPERRDVYYGLSQFNLTKLVNKTAALNNLLIYFDFK